MASIDIEVRYRPLIPFVRYSGLIGLWMSVAGGPWEVVWTWRVTLAGLRSWWVSP